MFKKLGLLSSLMLLFVSQPTRAVNTTTDYLEPVCRMDLHWGDPDMPPEKVHGGLTFGCGYVDARNGKIVVPLIYEHAEKFDQFGLAWVGWQNKTISIGPDSAPRVTSGERGYIGPNGPVVRNDFIAYPFLENKLIELPWKLAGYINVKGEVVVNKGNGFPFGDNGLARIKDQNEKTGYMDTRGNIVIPMRFESGKDFNSSPYAAVKLNGKWGAIDKRGNWVVPAEYGEVFTYKDGNVSVCDGTFGYPETKCGVYDVNRHAIGIPLTYYNPIEFQSNGLAMVYVAKSSRYGLINRAGRMVVPAIYQEMGEFAKNGLVKAKKDGKWGFIDASGRMAIPAIYDRAGDFADNDLAAVRTSGEKWGLIDPRGNWVVKPVYADIRNWSDELILAKNANTNRWGYIDRNGAVRIAFDYLEVRPFSPEGIAIVGIDGYYGYIDRKGEEVTPLIFNHVEPFSRNGVAQVAVKEAGKTRLIDTQGKFLSAFDDYIVLLKGDGERKGLKSEKYEIDNRRNMKQEFASTTLENYTMAQCMQYEMSDSSGTYALLKELHASIHGIDRILQAPACEPRKIGAHHKITMLQLTVEDPFSRYGNMEMMYKYIKKRVKNEQVWLNAINSTNTDGMTMLDYIHFVLGNGNFTSDEARTQMGKVRQFVCEHGGVYKKYPEQSCAHPARYR